MSLIISITLHFHKLRRQSSVCACKMDSKTGNSRNFLSHSLPLTMCLVSTTKRFSHNPLVKEFFPYAIRQGSTLCQQRMSTYSLSNNFPSLTAHKFQSSFIVYRSRTCCVVFLLLLKFVRFQRVKSEKNVYKLANFGYNKNST